MNLDFLTRTKKGSVIDIFYLSVVFSCVVMGIIILYYAFGLVYTGMVTAGFTPGELLGVTNFLQLTLDFDLLFLVIYVGAGLGAVISAFAVRTHPIYYIPFFLIQLIMLAVTPTLVGVYDEFYASPSINASTVQFTYTHLVMTNLPMLAFVLSVLIALAMFALPG